MSAERRYTSSTESPTSASMVHLLRFTTCFKGSKGQKTLVIAVM